MPRPPTGGRHGARHGASGRRAMTRSTRGRPRSLERRAGPCSAPASRGVGGEHSPAARRGRRASWRTGPPRPGERRRSTLGATPTRAARPPAARSPARARGRSPRRAAACRSGPPRSRGHGGRSALRRAGRPGGASPARKPARAAAAQRWGSGVSPTITPWASGPSRSATRATTSGVGRNGAPRSRPARPDGPPTPRVARLGASGARRGSFRGGGPGRPADVSTARHARARWCTAVALVRVRAHLHATWPPCRTGQAGRSTGPRPRREARAGGPR